MVNTYMLPVYNSVTDTWLIDNRDGTYKEISSAEYEKMFPKMFKTRYDKDEKD